LCLLLASSREEEARLKQTLERTGLYKCAVTEVGAKLAGFKQKVVGSVVAAALDCGVVSRTPHHVHALIHAAHEACQPFLDSALVEDLGVKVAIVRDSRWVVVAMFGECAAHHLTDHKQVGLGVMHMAY
jgi:hut operon positive regulator